MSVFGAIKDAIFGHKAAAAPAPQAAPHAAPTPAATPTPAPAAAAPAPRAALTAAQIEGVLADKAAARGEELNYTSSIVDLMKTLGLDSSLAERKKLATELGYTGDQDDSATMNIWLHEKVMARLAA